MHALQSRWEHLKRTTPALRVYALVDSVQYQTQLCKRLLPGAESFPLFADTPHAALAHAGPWLVDTTLASETMVAELATLERDTPSVIWLMAPQDIGGLGQLLQLRLDVRLPDGREGLLRFWDPRVLVHLARALDHTQREEFFGYIHEWHLLNEGCRVVIGRQHADPQ